LLLLTVLPPTSCSIHLGNFFSAELYLFTTFPSPARPPVFHQGMVFTLYASSDSSSSFPFSSLNCYLRICFLKPGSQPTLPFCIDGPALPYTCSPVWINLYHVVSSLQPFSFISPGFHRGPNFSPLLLSRLQFYGLWSCPQAPSTPPLFLFNGINL